MLIHIHGTVTMVSDGPKHLRIANVITFPRHYPACRAVPYAFDCKHIVPKLYTVFLQVSKRFLAGQALRTVMKESGK